jgi:hypothetical protein
MEIRISFKFEKNNITVMMLRLEHVSIFQSNGKNLIESSTKKNVFKKFSKDFHENISKISSLI